MRQLGYILFLVVSIAGGTASFADQGDLGADRTQAAMCYENKDWECAFDGMVRVFSIPAGLESCLGWDESHRHTHGCGYEMVAVTTAGVGASIAADPTKRRYIAERALSILKPMSEGSMEGELFFNGLRYDACKTLGDDMCRDESALMMRQILSAIIYEANLNPDGIKNTDAENIAEGISRLQDLFLSEDVEYPLDLNVIAVEVMQAELVE